MSFIERDDGQIYAPLFATVRLHGIVDSKSLYCSKIKDIYFKWISFILLQYNSPFIQVHTLTYRAELRLFSFIGIVKT